MNNLKHLLLYFCLLMATQANATNRYTLPFELNSKGHIVIPVSVNSQPEKNFVFDTGASLTVINASSDILSLVNTSEKKPLTVNRAHTSVEAFKGSLYSMGIGPLTQKQVEVVIMDISDVEADDYKTDGVIGYNFFSQYDININYKDQTLTFTEKHSPASCVAETGVDFKLNNGTHVQFPLKLGSVEIQAILDTGSPRTGINGNAANAILPNAVAQLKRAREAHSKNHTEGLEHGHTDMLIGQLGIGQISVGDQVLSQNHPTNVVNLPVFKSFGLAEKPGAIVGGDLLANRKVTISYSCLKLNII